MPKAQAPAAALPFDPTLPHAIPLPLEGRWADVVIVYDLYKAEAFLDDQYAWMAEIRRAARALQAQAAKIDALPEGEAKTDAGEALTRDLRAARRTNYLRQIAFYVQSVEWPYPAPPDPTQPEQWAAWPLFVLEWIATTGYAQARGALWDEKKVTPSATPSSSASSPPD